MLRRICYQTLGYYDPRLAQLPDFDFWIRLLFKYEIHILPEILIEFRILSGDANASAPRVDSLNRTLCELFHVLENYLKISSIEEYLSIFPEELSFIKDKDPDLLPFYLAQLFLRIRSPNSVTYKLMGIKTIFSMLSDPILKDKLEKRLGYYYTDFVKTSGTDSFIQALPSPPSLRNYLKKISSPKWVINKMKNTVKSFLLAAP